MFFLRIFFLSFENIFNYIFLEVLFLKKIKVLSVFGTRPEGIKMAPLVKRLEKHPNIESIFVNTGQHKEQLDQVLDLFDLSPKYSLNVMLNRPKLEHIFSIIFNEFSKILEIEKPDVVLVHGDTATTLASAQCAFFKQIPVAHIEAGLRTREMYSPFPEEMNRQLVSRITDFHFVPTLQNKINLEKESLNSENFFIVGNTGIDALLDIQKTDRQTSKIVEELINSKNRKIVLTTHRRENFDEMKNIFEAINEIIIKVPDCEIIFPAHLNPIVRQNISKHLISNERIKIIEPLDYYDFVQLLKHSYCILTDSGGIQEEAPALKKPVLVLRNSTERKEGVSSGNLFLTGTNKEKIVSTTLKLFNDENFYNSFSLQPNPFGTGNTSELIIEHLLQILHKK
jgi:UDP-N-acetylglucosamine 2-epimerase (non-hydrolysing)